MEFFSGKKTIGILGGGQLGKMMLSVTRKWDIKTKVMDPNEDAPSRIGCNKFVKGNLMNYENAELVFKLAIILFLLNKKFENKL